MEFMHELLAQHGRTLINQTWRKTDILCNDSENIKCMMATRFDDWEAGSTRQQAVLAFMGKGIFTTDGAFWSHSRSMLRPQFEKHAISDLHQFSEHIDNLLANIPADGSTVDLQDLFHRLTMDASSEFLMGTSTYSLRKDQSDRARRFGEAMHEGMADGMIRNLCGPLYHLVPHFKAWRAHRDTKEYVDEYVQRALRYKASFSEDEKDGKTTGKYIFLNELAKSDAVDAIRLRDEALNILLASRDTTGSLLSNLWFCLARHTEVWKKLQEEVDELHGELPTYEQLRDMKYIKYCAQESGHKYPIDS